MFKYQNWKRIQNLETSISIYMYYNKNCLLQWKDEVLKKEKCDSTEKGVCS